MRRNNLDEITIRQYFGLDGGIPESIEHSLIYEEADEMIHHVKSFFMDIFGVTLSRKEAALFTNDHMYKRYYTHHDYDDREYVNTLIRKYTRTVNAIKLCVDVTPAQINAAITVLKTLEVDIPIELYVAEDMRVIRKIGKNQKKHLYETELRHYFPFIDNEQIINKICSSIK
jgi:hypothetical protein